MGGWYYEGHRAFYSENGKLYDGVNKKHEIDPATLLPVTKSETRTAVAEVPKQQTETKTDSLVCPVCKFKAPFQEAFEGHMKIHSQVKK